VTEHLPLRQTPEPRHDARVDFYRKPVQKNRGKVMRSSSARVYGPAPPALEKPFAQRFCRTVTNKDVNVTDSSPGKPAGFVS